MRILPFEHPRLVAGTTTMLSVLLCGILVDRVFIHPAVRRSEDADAIVVLSGSPADRIPAAMSLIGRGLSTTLAMSVSAGCDGNQTASTEYSRLLEFEVIQFVPSPPTTSGEAIAIGRLVRERGWRRIVVVTSSYHTLRARLLIARCTEAQIGMVASRPHLSRTEWMRRIAHEVAGYLAAETPERFRRALAGHCHREV